MFNNNNLSNIFTYKNPKINNLKGDKTEIEDIESEFIKSISLLNTNNIFTNRNYINEKILKNLELNIEEADKKKSLNKSADDDYDSNSDEYNSLGEKKNLDTSITKMRKISIDFLSKLYNEGLKPYSQIGTEIEFNKKIQFKNNLCLNLDNPYVHSFTELHPFSFFYGNKTYLFDKNKKKKLILPEPKFIKIEDLQIEPNYTKNGIYKGIRIDDKNGLVITDPNITKKYSGLVSNIIIQILKVPFGHHISLQIKMFEPKTLIERLTNIFSFANKYLIKASDKNLNYIERFKLVLTFGFSGLYIPAQQLKPFNPFLGETFQGELPNGAKVYCEQVTHSPLCCRFYVVYHNIYKIYGYFNFSVSTEKLGSVMYIMQKGPVHVNFPQINETISYSIPKVKILNATSESNRSNLYDGFFSIVDVKNNLRGVIKFNENKKYFHKIYGDVFEYKFKKDFKFEEDKIWEFSKKYKLNSKKYKIIANINGSFIENLIWNNQTLWTIDKIIPEFIKPVKNAIPSDGRYREDLIWLYRSFYNSKNEDERLLYENIGQEFKIAMEKFNREERKNRQKNKKKGK